MKVRALVLLIGIILLFSLAHGAALCGTPEPAAGPTTLPDSTGETPESAKSGSADKSSSLPKVIIVTTGGTIAEKVDPKTGGAVPAVSGQDLVESVPSLKNIAEIEEISFSNIDSSHMNPSHWLKLAKLVDGLLEEPIAGVVVTHGTDTMAEGAFFLDLLLRHDKPVVFTGAMRTASDLSPDGPLNIYNAVAQAASPAAADWGVTVTTNNYINAARNVRKTQSTNVQTFESGESGYLGYILNGDITHINDRPEKVIFPLPDSVPDVALIRMYSGADGRLIRYAVDSGAKGIVVEAFGAGNVNPPTSDAIQYAISENIPVVVTTECYYGGAHPIYADEGGGASLQRAGAILENDLDGEKARILLMLALTAIGDDHDKLADYFE